MYKKIGLFVLSFIAILLVGVSFSDVIEPNTHYLDRCTKFKSANIDNYKIIYSYIWEKWPDECWHGSFNSCLFYVQPEIIWKVVKYSKGKCLPGRNVKIYLLNKKVDVNLLTQDNIEEKAIYVGNIAVEGSDYVDDSNPLTNETLIYRVIKNGDNYELKLIKSSGGVVELSADVLMKFGIARFITILIETIFLFIIAKLFRKKNHISNCRLLLIGILASTITLPLLRFVLPLFVTDETIYMVIGELSVTLIEIFIIKYGLKASRGKAILASVICNLCSFLTGLAIF